MTKEEIDPAKRHRAEYEAYEPSPSGKNQWKCVICGRITTGAERECYTIQMASKNICECGHPDFPDHFHLPQTSTRCWRCDYCGWFRERA